MSSTFGRTGGWCGGGTGWSRLFVRLYQLTGNAKYLEAVEQAARGVAEALPDLAMALPVVKGAPWDNLGQCCGAAGAGTFLLELATSQLPISNATRSAALVAAKGFGAAIMERAVPTDRAVGGVGVNTAGGLAFPSPEESKAPRDKRWQAGWMQGAAGVAAFLLHLNAVEVGGGQSGGGARVPWPDEPWGMYGGAGR